MIVYQTIDPMPGDTGSEPMPVDPMPDDAEFSEPIPIDPMPDDTE